jgi:hypothetical protein
MINKTNEILNKLNIFLSERPIIAIIIIVVLLVLIYKMSYTNSYHNDISEHMDQILPQCTVNTDQKFNNDYIKKSRMLNFKCNVKGIDYYLATVKMSDYTVNNSTSSKDCKQSMLILIPVTEIKTMLDSYLKDMSTAEQICNTTMQIQCNANNPKNPCPETYDICKQTRFFLHDFNIIDVTPSDADFSKVNRKYVIKGTAIPALNGQSSSTMINTFLIDEHGVSMVCGDTYSYGAPNIPKQYAEIIISERETTQNGGVVNDDPNLKIKIKFNKLQYDKNDKQIFNTCTNEPITKPVYLGVCDSTKTCSKGTNTYPRLCVYDDALDPNVLEFFPYVVN